MMAAKLQLILVMETLLVLFVSAETQSLSLSVLPGDPIDTDNDTSITTHRRMQAPTPTPYYAGQHFDGPAWRDASTAARQAAVAAVAPKQSPHCADSLATNHGAVGNCSYSCKMLATHFFPQHEFNSGEARVRCFLYDTKAGWPAELLSQVQTRRENHEV